MRVLFTARLSRHIAGCSQRVPGADWTCVVEQPPWGTAAAAAAPADTEGAQWKRPWRAGSILNPNRRPRCQLVNHQRALLLWIYKKKHHIKKPSIFLKAEKKNKRTKNVKNTSPLKEKSKMLASFLVAFLFFIQKNTPAHTKDFLWCSSLKATNLIWWSSMVPWIYRREANHICILPLIV